MVDLDKALHRTVAKMITEKVKIRKADIQRMVKDAVKKEIKRIADTCFDAAKAMIESEVDSQVCGKTEGYKRYLEKHMKQYIDNILNASNVVLIPKVDPCPSNAFEDWTHHHDHVLKERLRGFIAQNAVDLGRSEHSIFCRLRDKSFTKQEV